jgi:DNA-binding transcriptional ArsR family regulator
VTLRIWFTAEDLARTRVVVPDPFAETLFSLVTMRFGRHMGEWRHQVWSSLTPQLQPLLGILPRPGAMLDLITVTGPSASMDEGLDRLQALPSRVLDPEIDYFARTAGGIPGPLRPLLLHDRASRRDLADRLREYHDIAVAPFWSWLRGVLDTERTCAGQVLLDEGFDALFGRLAAGRLRWQPPVLEVVRPVQPAPETGPDHHLGGRGLLLVPSAFFWPGPVLFHTMHRDRPDVLAYPVAAATNGTFGPASVDRGLVELFGRTRAKVLTAAAGGVSSTELARRAGISLASASEHAAVLRTAGLLRTERVGRSVRHTVTGLGARLLDQGR